MDKWADAKIGTKTVSDIEKTKTQTVTCCRPRSGRMEPNIGTKTINGTERTKTQMVTYSQR